jgi:outer membrane murein-binding lipoprotein Lpp
LGTNFSTLTNFKRAFTGKLEGVEMVVKRRLGVLLAGTVLGTSILMGAPAFADDAQLQQQINAMQQQLNAMQAQLAQTKAQADAARQQASAAQQQASVANEQLQNIPPEIVVL